MLISKQHTQHKLKNQLFKRMTFTNKLKRKRNRFRKRVRRLIAKSKYEKYAIVGGANKKTLLR
jgi:hypothetical protein